jgi:hypothetical protein
LCFRNTMGGVSSDPSRLLAAALHSFTNLQGQHSTARHSTTSGTGYDTAQHIVPTQDTPSETTADELQATMHTTCTALL